jgi:hypothetical protein
MNCVAGRCLLFDFGWSSRPLLDVALAVLTLFVFDGANSLSRQESAVLTGLLSARLDSFGLNIGEAGLDHHVNPPTNGFEAQSYVTGVSWSIDARDRSCFMPSDFWSQFQPGLHPSIHESCADEE